MFFFFQAEDGIRDRLVTGVQTCAVFRSVGLMGGNLEDLEEGFEVEIEVASTEKDGSIICDSIACVS